MPENTPKRALPPRPHLDRLRTEARKHQKAGGGKLSEAQWAVAREYGFPSWRALKAYVEAVREPASVPLASDSLRSAANRKDIRRVRELLAAPEPPGQHELDLSLARALCAHGEEGTLPLRVAIADLLIAAGANPNGQYGGGYGPIVFALCEGVDADALAYLIARGADVSFPPVETKYGLLTPVFHAAWTYVRGRNAQRHRTLDLLLAHGAVAEDTPFLAILRGDVDRLAHFLEADAGLTQRRFPELAGRGDPDLAGATLLHLAIEYGESECAELLLRQDADLNAPATSRAGGLGGQTPIFHAVRSWKGAHFRLLRHLLEQHGAAIDWQATALLPMPYEDEPRQVTPAAFAGARERHLLLQHGVALPAPVAMPELPEEVLHPFRNALMEGELDALYSLLQTHPALAVCRPWAPRWEGGALEAVARRCVWHRPRMREIAELLLAYGAEASLPTLARAGLKTELLRRLEDEPWRIDEPDAQGRTPLFRAACVYGAFPEGEAVADALLARGARVDLATACTFGLVETARTLLAADPGLASRADGDGMLPLHWACRNRRNRAVAPEIIRLLCAAGAPLEAPNPSEEGMHPLHHCAEWATSRECIEALLEAGADLNALSGSGWTPLDYAVDRGRHAIAAFLVEKGARTTREDVARQLLLAISRGEHDTARQLLTEHPTLINEPGHHPLWGGRPQPLHVAIEHGDEAFVVWLLDSGADLDGTAALYDRWSPLLIAYHHRRRGIAKLLRERGATLGLLEALYSGEEDPRAFALLEADPTLLATPMPSLASPLRFARTVPAARKLLELGAPLERRDRYGRTPLEALAQENAPEPVLSLLIAHGAAVSPMLLALLGDLERLKESAPGLVDAEAAFAALRGGRTEVLAWLLANGLAPGTRRATGSHESLLHAAAWEGNAAATRLLLQAGADPGVLDDEHRTTPAQWARTALERLGREACREVCEILQFPA